VGPVRVWVLMVIGFAMLTGLGAIVEEGDSSQPEAVQDSGSGVARSTMPLAEEGNESDSVDPDATGMSEASTDCEPGDEATDECELGAGTDGNPTAEEEEFEEVPCKDGDWATSLTAEGGISSFRPAADLPLILNSPSSACEVRFAERLLNATCCEVEVDGVWSSQDDAAMDSLRTSLDVPWGFLTARVWNALFSRPREDIAAVSGGLEAVPIPASAVLVELSEDGDQAIYTLAQETYLADMVAWFEEALSNEAMVGWEPCSTTSLSSTYEFRWWQPGSTNYKSDLLSLKLHSAGPGRVDFVIRTYVGPVNGCGNFSEQDPSGPTTSAPVRISLRNLSVSAEQYRWDHYDLDWKWRPVGTYTNRSELAIVAAEVEWKITSSSSWGDGAGTFVDRVEKRIGPGETIPILDGLWFLLRIDNSSHADVGIWLGTDRISIRYEVRFLEFEDGRTVGSR